jgi:hypothetical protein
MTGTEILVTGLGVELIALLSWFFFGPKQGRRAELRGAMQEVEITVKGGYSPNLIRVKEGVPLRLIFDRQENSDCSSRVVFPDFGVSTSLAAFGRTTWLRQETAGARCRPRCRSPCPAPRTRYSRRLIRMRWPGRWAWDRLARSAARLGLSSRFEPMVLPARCA